MMRCDKHHQAQVSSNRRATRYGRLGAGKPERCTAGRTVVLLQRAAAVVVKKACRRRCG